MAEENKPVARRLESRQHLTVEAGVAAARKPKAKSQGFILRRARKSLQDPGNMARRRIALPKIGRVEPARKTKAALSPRTRAERHALRDSALKMAAARSCLDGCLEGAGRLTRFLAQPARLKIGGKIIA